MLSRSAKAIIEDVDQIQKDACIEPLLLKYDGLEKKFIQKYIETKIAFFGNKITSLAFIFGELSIIIAIMISVSLFLYPEYHQNLKQVYTVALVILFMFSIILVCLYVKVLFDKNVLKDIIIAIEDDDKLTTERQEESIVALKQDDISSNVDISLNNFESSTIGTYEKADKTVVQQKFHQILEEHRWITNLIWNKIHALIIVNGILFSAFNLLVIADSNSNFIMQKASLIIIGFLISVFWFFILKHSITFKDNYRRQIFKMQQDHPEFSIDFIDDHHYWSRIFGTNVVAKISTIGISVAWLVLLIGLKIGFL